MRTNRRMCAVLAVAGLAAAAAAPLAAQGDRQPPAVNQPAIDTAIKKGAEWLLEQAKGGIPNYQDEWQTLDELALYALLHAGVDPKNPEVVKLLKLVAERIPKHTYTNAIRAQAMQKYDARMLAEHVRGAAQWLVDNQGQRGLWGYGKEVHIPEPPKITVTPDPKKVYTGPKGGAVIDGTPGARNTTATARTVLKRNGWGDENDNSNSQYALLGLAACMAGGFYPPQDCLDLAEKWYRKGLDSKGFPEDVYNGLRYDLAELLESQGKNKDALAIYKEVYASNANYRDVKDKIDSLK